MNWVSIASSNALSPVSHQAITWINADLLSVGPLGTNFSWIRFKIQTLQWGHNEQDGVSNHHPHDCLLNRLFGSRSKKRSKLRVTGLCGGNSPGPVNSPHKGSVTRKMFPFDDVIMKFSFMKMQLKMPSAIWRPFCPRRNEWKKLPIERAR